MEKRRVADNGHDLSQGLRPKGFIHSQGMTNGSSHTNASIDCAQWREESQSVTADVSGDKEFSLAENGEDAAMGTTRTHNGRSRRQLWHRFVGPGGFDSLQSFFG